MAAPARAAPSSGPALSPQEKALRSLRSWLRLWLSLLRFSVPLRDELRPPERLVDEDRLCVRVAITSPPLVVWPQNGGRRPNVPLPGAKRLRYSLLAGFGRGRRSFRGRRRRGLVRNGGRGSRCRLGLLCRRLDNAGFRRGGWQFFHNLVERGKRLLALEFLPWKLFRRLRRGRSLFLGRNDVLVDAGIQPVARHDADPGRDRIAVAPREALGRNRAALLRQGEYGCNSRRFRAAHRIRVMIEVALRTCIDAVGADPGLGEVQVHLHDPALRP